MAVSRLRPPIPPLVWAIAAVTAGACAHSPPIDPADDPAARAAAWKSLSACPPGGTMAAQLERVRCHEAMRHILYKDQAYLRAADGERRVAAEQLLAAARQEGARERPGARHLLGFAATCLSPTAAPRDEWLQARTQLVEATGARFHVRVVGRGAAQLKPYLAGACAAAAQPTGEAVRCAESGDGVPVLEIAGDLGRPVHSERVHARAITYEVGRNVDPNPAYDGAIAQLRMAESAFTDHELPTKEAVLRCEEAERARSNANYCYGCPEEENEKRACDNARSMKDVLERRQSDLDDARRRVDQTPATIETPITDVHSYREIEHIWQAKAGVAVAGLGRTIVDDREPVVFTDLQHDGFAPAGLAEDPLTEPQPAQYLESLAARAVSHLAGIFAAERANRAAPRRTRCPGAIRLDASADDLQCQAELLLLDARPVDAAALGLPGCN